MLKFNLPCKKYVKHYLENCFGSPSYIRKGSHIGKYFFHLLEDAPEREDKENMYDYDSICTIEITEDVFLRNGYVLSKTGIRLFNTFVEDQFKTQIRTIIETMVEFQGQQINKAIDCVYDKFDMDETIMPHETIRKDYQRYRKDLEALKTK